MRLLFRRATRAPPPAKTEFTFKLDGVVVAPVLPNPVLTSPSIHTHRPKKRVTEAFNPWVLYGVPVRFIRPYWYPRLICQLDKSASNVECEREGDEDLESAPTPAGPWAAAKVDKIRMDPSKVSIRRINSLPGKVCSKKDLF